MRQMIQNSLRQRRDVFQRAVEEALHRGFDAEVSLPEEGAGGLASDPLVGIGHRGKQRRHDLRMSDIVVLTEQADCEPAHLHIRV